MMSQKGSSLLKSCACRSFSFTCGNLQAFATHSHSLGDPLLGHDPWLEKHCTKTTHQVCSSKISKYLGINFRKSHKIVGFYHPHFTSYN